METAKFLQIVTTIDDRQTADALAKALVERKLAACVQVTGPVTSIYRWEGAIETATEWQLLIKSRSDLYRNVEAAIQALHPYKVPEIIAIPIIEGLGDYLRWIDENVACEG